MRDLIDRQAAIDEIRKCRFVVDAIEKIRALPSAQPEIIGCKDCKKAPKCYGDVVMRSKGGGYIYCPLTYCSEAERRTDETD